MLHMHEVEGSSPFETTMINKNVLSKAPDFFRGFDFINGDSRKRRHKESRAIIARLGKRSDEWK